MNRWVDAAGGEEDFDMSDDVPFAETRAYVENVLERKKEYRKNYGDELGL